MLSEACEMTRLRFPPPAVWSTLGLHQDHRDFSHDTKGRCYFRLNLKKSGPKRFLPDLILQEYLRILAPTDF